MSFLRSRGVLLKMFSSAVASQAVLSGSSLLVGLLLVRLSSDAQYGSYVLVWNAVLLLTSLQNAFMGPAMVIRMAPLEHEARGQLIGGLYREQRRLLPPLLGAGLLTVAALWLLHKLDDAAALLCAAAAIAGVLALKREFFRMTLLARRHAQSVLKGDALYSLVLVTGAALATLLPLQAPGAVLALALAALASGSLLARHLRHREAWSESGAHGILRQILPLGLWSAAGAAIHWAFSQGYSFLVAGSLNVSAVAALAAMRMLLTPVNLLSCGISSLMLGMTSSWLQKYPVTVVFRRQLLFASGLAGAALCYTLLVWLLRDWICAHVLKRQFAQRDTLLLLWSAVFLVMVFRDQLVSLLVVRERLRRLTALTFASALCSLAVSGWGISKFGTAGALLGVLTGELINVGGLVLLSLREAAQEHEPELHAAVGLAGK